MTLGNNGSSSVTPAASGRFNIAVRVTDGLGVAIPGVKVSLGQFKAGPEFIYRHETADGTVLEPHLGVQAIWNVSGDDEVTNLGGTLSGPEEVRGRIELGLKAKFPSGIGVDVSGSYDGLGSSAFESVGGRATVRVPLN